MHKSNRLVHYFILTPNLKLINFRRLVQVVQLFINGLSGIHIKANKE